ncbi:hypothetical protein [Symbioplanes lichenis]|uniref:hypothetical protein n=1 Tax=Symbioplanes lichenis TaxID=1629072 RepID=UPI00273A3AFB|nr:hypothetical protein [Actinoplanes lichenis]
MRHDLIREAQRLPDTCAAGGAERIRSLGDRLWFKVKTGRWRGAATDLPHERGGRSARWWLGAGGYRRDGDPADFYAVLAAAAKRAARTSTSPASSDRWLPTQWDWDRLEAEETVAWELQPRRVIGGMIARSLRDGRAYHTVFRRFSVTAVARAQDGETYLVIGFDTAADAGTLSAILRAVPGIEEDDWMIEPGKVLGIEAAPGEHIWSTALPTRVAADLLALFSDED